MKTYVVRNNTGLLCRAKPLLEEKSLKIFILHIFIHIRIMLTLHEVVPIELN